MIGWAFSGGPRLTLARAESLAFEVGLPVAVFYAPLLLARRGARNGQTIGKQAMGIRVVRQDGLPVTFATALVREALGRQVPALLTSGLYVPVDYLWPLWDARNQALHDKIGRTYVVSALGSASVPPGEPSAARGRGWAAPVDNGTPSPSEPVRGDWLPPVPPSREVPD